MAWLNLGLEILGEFAAAHHLVDQSTSQNDNVGGLDTRRRAWRERNAAQGKCRSCRRPALHGRQSCHVHLDANAARARRSDRARRAAPQT